MHQLLTFVKEVSQYIITGELRNFHRLCNNSLPTFPQLLNAFFAVKIIYTLLAVNSGGLNTLLLHAQTEQNCRSFSQCGDLALKRWT